MIEWAVSFVGDHLRLILIQNEYALYCQANRFSHTFQYSPDLFFHHSAYYRNPLENVIVLGLQITSSKTDNGRGILKRFRRRCYRAFVGFILISRLKGSSDNEALLYLLYLRYLFALSRFSLSTFLFPTKAPHFSCCAERKFSSQPFSHLLFALHNFLPD